MTAFITLIIGILSVMLFRYAAGTLSLGKLNLVSYSFYLIMLQAYMGCVLVSCGFDKHYTLDYLLDRYSIVVATNMLWILMLLMPLVMLAVYKVFRFDPRKEFSNYLNREIVEKDDRLLFIVFAGTTVIQLVLLAILIRSIGYVPFLKIIHHEADFDFATERIRIQGITALGSGLVTNLIVKLGIPLVSYIAFAYAFINKRARWIVLAVVSLCMGVVVKTLDFSKSPLAFYFLIFVFILIYSKKGGIKDRVVMIFIAAMAGLLAAVYIVQGYSGSFLDIYNGILGRTLFTQFGTLCYHFDLFPKVFPFLAGRSLSPTILKIIGIDPALHLRSARLVMAYYGIEKVYDGKAGVMNTIYMGEAYANWGTYGAILAVIFVGIYIALFFVAFSRMRKTPLSIALYAFFTQTIGAMTQGGFTDFIYSSTIILVAAFGLVFMNYKKILNASRHGDKRTT